MSSGSAFAQTSVHATAAAAVAYTDNAFSDPENPGPERQEPLATPFVLLSPGVVLYHDEKRARYLASYQHDFAFFIEAPDRNTGIDVARGQGIFALSPLDTLTLGLLVAQSPFTQLMVQAGTLGAENTQIGGAGSRLRTDLVQAWEHQLSPRWRLKQGAEAGVIWPLSTEVPQPRRYRYTGLAGLEYVQVRDALGVEASATYFLTTRVDEEPVLIPAERYVIGDLVGRWRRDLSLRWAMDLSGGVGVARRIRQDDSTVWPLWGGGLHYVTRDGSGILSYRRGQNVSLENAALFISDEVALEVRLPLSREYNLRLATSNGAGRYRQLLLAEDDEPESVNAWRSEVRFGWSPDLVSVELSYQHFEQFGGEEGALLLPNFTRNVVMLSVAGMFPQRRLREVPIEPSPRVDEGGVRRIGGDQSNAGAAGPARSSGPIGPTPDPATR